MLFSILTTVAIYGFVLESYLANRLPLELNEEIEFIAEILLQQIEDLVFVADLIIFLANSRICLVLEHFLAQNCTKGIVSACWW
jgi:hypothetical protein